MDPLRQQLESCGRNMTCSVALLCELRRAFTQPLDDRNLDRGQNWRCGTAARPFHAKIPLERLSTILDDVVWGIQACISV